jgi:acetoin utilization deacetylase AcuC-like enzyme
VGAVRRGIEQAGLLDRLALIPPRPARREELQRVHTDRLIDAVAATAGKTYRFDPDTQAGPHTYAAALAAAGSVIDAVDRVLDGETDRAFCNVRPPGHHAERDRVMGFCYFNSVAAAAAHAVHRGLERVLVVDWDVHHGNGTQEIFEDDPRVLYVSSHAFPFYPGTGALDEVGRGRGAGFTVNLPLPAGCGDAEYVVLYREVVLPVAHEFAPQIVLVSAGFDPYVDDPLAGMAVTERGFAQLMALCLEMAEGSAGGRTIVALEGGYDLDGLAKSAAATLGVLVGEPAPAIDAAPAPGFDRLLDAFRAHHAQHWKSLRA